MVRYSYTWPATHSPAVGRAECGGPWRIRFRGGQILPRKPARMSWLPLAVAPSGFKSFSINKQTHLPSWVGVFGVGHGGFEPPTHGLRGRCSATELMTRSSL